MLFGVILIWIAVLMIWYYMTQRRIFIMGKKLPGPKGYPIIGNALIFYGTPVQVFRRITKLRMTFNRLTTLWIGPKLAVGIFNAKDAEIILKNKYVMKPDEYKYLRPWLGDSILISEGAKFRHNKKLLTPAFHSQNLRGYLDVFSEHGEDLIQKLNDSSDKGEFDIYPLLTIMTMDVLLETFMGVDKDTLGQDALMYSKAVEKLGKCALTRAYKVLQRIDIIFKYSNVKKEQDKYLKIINELTDKVIEVRKQKYLTSKANHNKTDESTSKWPIFLDKFLEVRDENGFGLTEQDIKDEVMTMMFAGQDTTTVSIGFALCMLGLHASAQDKLIAEVDSIFPDITRKVTYDDLKKMHYMEKVIQETWRLFPPIPMVAKRPMEDIDLGDLVIPRDCSIALAIIAIHRDPQQYKNPDDFDPDNFLPERIKERNPFSFIPFSGGSRTCIGPKYAMMLVKVILSYILRHYIVSSTIPPEKYKLASQTSLKRKDGFIISLAKRKCSTVI